MEQTGGDRALPDSANAAVALGEYTALLAHYMDVFDADHPDTLALRVGLARGTGFACDPSGAVSALAKLLADYAWVLPAPWLRYLVATRILAHRRQMPTRPALSGLGLHRRVATAIGPLGPVPAPRTADAAHRYVGAQAHITRI